MVELLQHNTAALVQVGASAKGRHSKPIMRSVGGQDAMLPGTQHLGVLTGSPEQFPD